MHLDIGLQVIEAHPEATYICFQLMSMCTSLKASIQGFKKQSFGLI